MKNLEELTITDVLREFVLDCETAFPSEGKRSTADRLRGSANGEPDWFDLAATYEHAKHVLHKDQRMRHDAKKPLRIKKFLFKGQTSGKANNTRELLGELGRLLDKSYSHEIFGEVVFEAEDGITYVATVEGVIGQVDEKYLRELQEAEDNDE